MAHPARATCNLAPNGAPLNTHTTWAPPPLNCAAYRDCQHRTAPSDRTARCPQSTAKRCAVQGVPCLRHRRSTPAEVHHLQVRGQAEGGRLGLRHHHMLAVVVYLNRLGVRVKAGALAHLCQRGHTSRPKPGGVVEKGKGLLPKQGPALEPSRAPPPRAHARKLSQNKVCGTLQPDAPTTQCSGTRNRRQSTTTALATRQPRDP